jgi:hypothetical protein
MATKEFVPSFGDRFVVFPAFPTEEMTRDANYAPVHRFVGSAQLTPPGRVGGINQELECLNSHRIQIPCRVVVLSDENQRRSRITGAFHPRVADPN